MNNNEFDVDYGAKKDTLEDASSLKRYEDLTFNWNRRPKFSIRKYQILFN